MVCLSLASSWRIAWYEIPPGAKKQRTEISTGQYASGSVKTAASLGGGVDRHDRQGFSTIFMLSRQGSRRQNKKKWREQIYCC